MARRAPSGREFLHHVAEFLELDLPVAVLVDLLQQLAQGVVLVVFDAERALDLVRRDGARAVLVEEAEGGLEFLLRDKVLLVHGRHDELCVVNAAVAVDVDGVEHGVDLVGGHLNSEVLLVALGHLLLVERAVAVLVHELEDFLEVLLLLFVGEVGRDEGQRGLLDLLVALRRQTRTTSNPSKQRILIRCLERGRPRRPHLP